MSNVSFHAVFSAVFSVAAFIQRNWWTHQPIIKPQAFSYKYNKIYFSAYGSKGEKFCSVNWRDKKSLMLNY